VTGNDQCKDLGMKPPLPRTLSAVPQTMHARLEIAKAIRTLAGPDEDELLRQRRAEIAAIRRDLEALSRNLHKAFEAAATLAKAELRAALKKYSADQARVPAGNSKGGQWTSEGNVALYSDTQVLSDAPDPTWTPGAQSAQNRPRGGSGPVLINGQWLEPTPGEAARLAIALPRW